MRRCIRKTRSNALFYARLQPPIPGAHSKHERLHTMTNPPLFHSTVTGVPRIGPNRELKKALESYWKTVHANDAQKLSDTAYALNADITQRILGEGLDQAPTVGRSFYDAVLDTSALLGCCPSVLAISPTTTAPCRAIAMWLLLPPAVRLRSRHRQ